MKIDREINFSDFRRKAKKIISHRKVLGLSYLESYLEPPAPFKDLYGAIHLFNLVAQFNRLFGATQSFFGVAPF